MIMDSRGLSHFQRVLIMYEFESTINEAVRQLKLGAKGWEYLSAMIGGAAIVLSGWGACGLVSGTLFVLTSSAIVGGPIAITAVVIGGIGAISCLGIFSVYRRIVDMKTRAKIKSKMKKMFKNNRSRFYDCIGRIGYNHDDGFISAEMFQRETVGISPERFGYWFDKTDIISSGVRSITGAWKLCFERQYVIVIYKETMIKLWEAVSEGECRKSLPKVLKNKTT